MTDQRTEALARANESRARKARTRQRIAGMSDVEALRWVAACLTDPDVTALDSFKIGELLVTIPKIGKSKATMLAAQAERLEPMRRVRQLSPRQRGVLAQVLLNRADEVAERHASVA